MSLAPGELRQALSQYPTGVTVLAAAAGDRIHAMTAGSVTSVSLEPPLLLVCVARQARMATLLDLGVGFSVNVLRADQQSLSTYFAGSWKEPAPPPHRFREWEGVPRLEGTALSLGCRVSAVHEGGDHLIVVGAVAAIHHGLPPRDPLVFFNRRYHRLGSGQGEVAPEIDSGESTAQLFHEPW